MGLVVDECLLFDNDYKNFGSLRMIKMAMGTPPLSTPGFQSWVHCRAHVTRAWWTSSTGPVCGRLLVVLAVVAVGWR